MHISKVFIQLQAKKPKDSRRREKGDEAVVRSFEKEECSEKEKWFEKGNEVIASVIKKRKAHCL